jgi:hypothetical protein
MTAATHSAIVELRQYAMKPGGRDVLLDIFERHFIESQEAVGMKVIGHFRDLDDPDRFVWLRGFTDMGARGTALEIFYTSELWKEHRDAVNATLVDSENVLLLRPAHPESGFPAGMRREEDDGGERCGVVIVTVYPLAAPANDELSALFEQELKPQLLDAGATVAAAFVTEPSENNFPGLPIREGENVFVSVARFPGLFAHEALESSPGWRATARELGGRVAAPPQTLRLEPSRRSELG